MVLMNKPPSTEIFPAHLRVKSDTPQWFDWALAQPCESHIVEVTGCPIHYLLWDRLPDTKPQRGLLLVHGGGAHANWWRFIAPFFLKEFRVAALDLSGMGDSGTREEYSAADRAQEMRAVIADADLGDAPFIVGHSFGGYMTLRFCVDFGDEIGGAIIADTPVRPPDDPPPGRAKRIFNHTRNYPDFEEAVARFRLLPEQTCEHPFLVEFIARHSLKREGEAWKWKFDPHAMGAKRWEEPFDEHMQNMRCRSALIHGQYSALVDVDRAAYMSRLMGPQSPVVEIPEAQHHLMLDQPLAFVSTVRALLQAWQRADYAGA